MNFKDPRAILLSISGLALSVIPKIGCPLCWGVQIGYTGVFLTAYVFVHRHTGLLAAVAMTPGWVVLACKVKERGSYTWLMVITGLFVSVLLSKAAGKSMWMAGLFIAALLATSIWTYGTKARTWDAKVVSGTQKSKR